MEVEWPWLIVSYESYETCCRFTGLRINVNISLSQKMFLVMSKKNLKEIKKVIGRFFLNFHPMKSSG